MLYRQTLDVEAHRITDPATAAQILGGTVAAAAPESWLVAVTISPTLTVYWSGELGDYLTRTGDGWRSVPAAEFQSSHVEVVDGLTPATLLPVAERVR